MNWWKLIVISGVHRPLECMTNPELELERYISNLEGQLTAARFFLQFLKSGNAEFPQPNPLPIPFGGDAETVMKESVQHNAARLTGTLDCIRDAVRKMGSTFTNRDIDRYLQSRGIRFEPQRITASLWKLAKEHGEIVVTRSGKGGISPIYQKREDQRDAAAVRDKTEMMLSGFGSAIG